MYAVALVVLSALLSINELGVSLAVVRWPGDVGRIAPTVTTLAAASSVTLYAACFVLAPTVAHALNAPEATGVLRVLALSVLVDAVTAVPMGVMTRDFLQRRRVVIDLAAFVVSAATSISLAVAGFGAWSLVWGTLIGNVVTAILVLQRKAGRFRPGFDVAIARDLLEFGLPLAGASMLTFAMLNVDYIVVGATLDKIALGLYLLAFNLSSWPVKMISAPVRRVSMRAFAHLQEDSERMSEAFARAAALLLAAAAPACLLLGLFSRPIIELLYAPRWIPAARPLLFLAILALVRVLVELSYDLLVALGRSRANFVLHALWLIALIPAMIVGSRWDGIRGVAVAHTFVALLIVLPAFAVVLRRAGVSLERVFALMLRPLLGIILASIIAATALMALDRPFLQLAVGGPATLIVYGAVVHPVARLLKGRDQQPAEQLV